MMRHSIGQFFIGLTGTAFSLTLPEAAAVFAGTSTGVWMLVQCALAVRKDFKTRPRR